MGMAYGAPLRWNGETFDFDDAQKACRHDGDLVLWRVEAVSYSYIVDAEHDEYGSTDPRLEVFSIPVLRWTLHGATLVRRVGVRNQWVDLRPNASQWASRTPADALEQFRLRRQRQLYVLRKQIARAERELALCSPSPYFAPLAVNG